MYIHHGIEQSKYLEKPNDYGYHNHNIQDSFYFTIHGDVRIDKP